jgi:hypothetical protein
MMHYASIGNVDQICSVASDFAHFFSVHHALPITAERFAALVNARHRKENMDLVAAFIVIKIAY